MFYDISKILSYHVPLYFCLGNRNIGKTFAWKKHIIKNFIKKHEEFIILCRYKDEIKSLMKNYFDDVENVKYKEFHFFNKGNIFYFYNKLNNKTSKMGYCYALSDYLSLKKKPHPKVNTIIFDEFLNEDNKYIKNKNEPNQEAKILLNVYQSVARGDGNAIRNNVRMVLISNAITTANPYFNYFKIDELIEKNITINQTKFFKKDGLIIEIKYDNEIVSLIEKSKFNKLIKSTDYNDFAQKNKFYLDNNALISDIPKYIKSHIIHIIFNETIYILSNYKNNYYFYNTNKLNKKITIFTYTDKDHRHDFLNFKLLKANELYNLILEAYYSGSLYFNNQTSKNVFLFIFNQLQK